MALPGLKTPEEIAAEIWGIPVERLTEKTRKREVVEARQVLMNYRNVKLKLSQAVSGAPYGKDHCTVIHANKTITALLSSNKEFIEKHSRFIKAVTF